MLCLDFGTAKSKAFAATDHEEDPELEPLPIGAGDEDPDESLYEVSSCVWIDDDGRLYVGSEAVKRGMNYGDDPATRRPLDSLKQEISQVDPEDGAAELAGKLPREVDPTRTLTYGHAISIYLAYLTDLATTAVERRVGTRLRAPPIHRAVLALDAAPLGGGAAGGQSAARAVVGGYLP